VNCVLPFWLQPALRQLLQRQTARRSSHDQTTLLPNIVRRSLPQVNR
jgi:hypothetical protein